jgi:hypothetical protein
LLSFVTLAARTFITYRYSIIYYQRFMLGFLNDKAYRLSLSLSRHTHTHLTYLIAFCYRMSSDRDVLLYLIDKLKLQELKEVNRTASEFNRPGLPD